MQLHTLNRLLRGKAFQWILGACGILGILSTSSPTNASVERERDLLNARVAKAREIIRNNEASKHPETKPPVSSQKLAQWYPWGNWGNWRNW